MCARNLSHNTVANATQCATRWVLAPLLHGEMWSGLAMAEAHRRHDAIDRRTPVTCGDDTSLPNTAALIQAGFCGYRCPRRFRPRHWRC